LTESFVGGLFLNPTTATKLGITQTSAFLMTVAPGVSETTAEHHAKTAFYAYGLFILDFAQILRTSIQNTEAVIGLLEVFVALGLGVGIAAMGIVALRAVVERRREIGMIRANGFTRGMVLRAFFLEYSFVTLVGLAIGTALGLLIVWNLTQGPSAAGVGVPLFAVPWTNLVIILGLAYGLSMLAVAQPSLRAARLPPAEAVRPTE
ncbi:MAG: ABC transporter permease, partial [Thermoplasmata archaeon]